MLTAHNNIKFHSFCQFIRNFFLREFPVFYKTKGSFPPERGNKKRRGENRAVSMKTHYFDIQPFPKASTSALSGIEGEAPGLVTAIAEAFEASSMAFSGGIPSIIPAMKYPV